MNRLAMNCLSSISTELEARQSRGTLWVPTLAQLATGNEALNRAASGVP